MKHVTFGTIALATTLLVNCTTPAKNMVIATDQVDSGTSVYAGANKIPLYKGSLKVGDNLIEIGEKHGMKIPATVAIINVVPSIDTAVCEEQSHILGENSKIAKNISKLTISRDLPMAQERFAKAANLTNINYFSDYKTGSFGKSTGLMMQGKELLARAVIVTDSKGVIRYMQIVRDITQLPNMAKAIEFANNLAR